MGELLGDPFLVGSLNPLLLDTLRNYWQTLKSAKVSEEEKLQIEEALYNLIRFAFRHLLQPLYLKYVPQVKGRVFLLSAVHSDGIGDYMSLLRCAQLLKQQHYDLDVQIVFTHQQRLPPVDRTFDLIRKEDIHDFQETPDHSSKILGQILEGKANFSFEGELEQLLREKGQIEKELEDLKDHREAALAIKEIGDDMDKPIKQARYFLRKKEEAEQLYRQMQESLALIHIALALNTFDNPILAPKSIYFAEAGNFQGIANYLQRNWFSMGLDAFEEGIFLKKQKEVPYWENVKLTQYLWKKEQPRPDQIRNYLMQNSLQVAYLPRIAEQRRMFIELICRRYINDERHLDILIPQDEEIFEPFDQQWMIAYGISQVVVVQTAPSIKETVVSQVDLPAEKRLRLIQSLPVSSADFIKLINLSGEVVGCTGDGSLSDCLIAGKIPFYEVRRHKLSTLTAFMHLARKLTLPDVFKYFEQLEKLSTWPSKSLIESFDTILNEGTFKMQWKILMEFIKSYYCFEDAFLSHVNRHLYTNFPGEVTEKEETLVQDYFEGLISAENVYQTFEKVLKNRSIRH